MPDTDAVCSIRSAAAGVRSWLADRIILSGGAATLDPTYRAALERFLSGLLFAAAAVRDDLPADSRAGYEQLRDALRPRGVGPDFESVVADLITQGNPAPPILRIPTTPQAEGEPPALERIQQGLERLAAGAAIPRGRETLNEIEQAALDYIATNPGQPGDRIAKAIGKSVAHFKSRIVPKLREFGVTNDGRTGYRVTK